MNSNKCRLRWSLGRTGLAVIPLTIFAITIILFGVVGWMIGGAVVAIFTGIFGQDKYFKFVMCTIIMITGLVGYLVTWLFVTVFVGMIIIILADVMTSRRWMKPDE